MVVSDYLTNSLSGGFKNSDNERYIPGGIIGFYDLFTDGGGAFRVHNALVITFFWGGYHVLKLCIPIDKKKKHKYNGYDWIIKMMNHHLNFSHWAKPLMIIFALIGGLCFGQSIWIKDYPKIAFPEPIAISSSLWHSEIGIETKKLSHYSAVNASGYLNPNLLMLQVESETLQPKTSFWKQAGIYELEFLGAELSAAICAGIATISIMEEGDVGYWPIERWPFVYVGGNILLTSSCTWGIGKLLKQKGAWWKTAIGTGLGGVAGSSLIMYDVKDAQTNNLLLIIGISLTALGTVVGFNL